VARALEIDPGSAIGNAIVGAELNRTGEPARAVPYLRAAVARDPGSSDFHYNLGNALFRMGAFEKSTDEFSESIALEQPPSWRAMNNLGVAYAKMGRKDEAIAEFNRVLEIYPDNAEAKQNLRVMTGGVRSR
jgi:tetratricopeptide (TPR) repeat protein